jgi:hypothetical protein
MLRIVRRLLPYTTGALVAALAHLVWTGIARREASRRAERRIARPAFTPAPEAFQASGLRILHFYADAAEAAPGRDAALCYGVLNAKSVRIEPVPGEVSPSLSRCISVAPVRTTTYTLHAEGDGGERVSASFTLPVRATR